MARELNVRFDLSLTRRQVLRLGAIGTAALALPTRRLLAQRGGAAAGPVAPFLTAVELATVDAAVSRIIPTDTLPGAHEAGVADYIQGLLSALPFVDANCDDRRTAADFTAIALRQGTNAEAGCRGADVNGDGVVNATDLRSAEVAFFAARPIFGGGPFSGRQPFGDFAAGQVTDVFPTPSFDNAIPLNRVQRLAWTVRLDGAASVPEVADNPLATALDEVDLRRKYRDGIAEIEQMSHEQFSQPFAQIAPEDQDTILTLINPDFVTLLTNHSVEGLLCDPAYGGNRDRIGWQLVGFDGDSQPLGYTLGFDEPTQQYIERADRPNSKPNPSEDCHSFGSTMIAFLTVVATNDLTKPNARFPSPFCFEVST